MLIGLELSLKMKNLYKLLAFRGFLNLFVPRTSLSSNFLMQDLRHILEF